MLTFTALSLVAREMSHTKEEKFRVYLEFKVNLCLIDKEFQGHRPEFVTSQLSCVEKKIVLVTRERRANGKGIKEIGKGAKAPYNFGVHHDSRRVLG